MAGTPDERRAQLEAELKALDAEDRETRIANLAKQTSLRDVIAHLVRHSGGYPTLDDRDAHARAVEQHFAPVEDAAPAAPAGGQGDEAGA